MLQNLCLSVLVTKAKQKMATDILTKTFISMRQRLFASARKMLDDDADADDALQDAFFRLWQRRDKIESRSQAEGLSVITVKNICIDTLRRRQTIEITPIETADRELSNLDDDDDRRETYKTVKNIIDRRLSERERQVITMRDTMDMAFEDIASELGITENNVRMILSRARKTVREIYLSTQK